MSLDISQTIVAKSDQLNADDLLGGSIVVQVEGVSVSRDEQPVTVKISGGHRPWKPCKTTRRVLAAAWGVDASQWFGRWVELYRDEAVKWAGVEVGGIRIKAMSHIDKRGMTLNLAESKKKKRVHRMEYLEPPAPAISLEDALSAHSLTVADFNSWALANNRAPADRMSAEQRAKAAAWIDGGGHATIAAAKQAEPAGDAGELEGVPE